MLAYLFIVVVVFVKACILGIEIRDQRQANAIDLFVEISFMRWGSNGGSAVLGILGADPALALDTELCKNIPCKIKDSWASRTRLDLHELPWSDWIWKTNSMGELGRMVRCIWLREQARRCERGRSCRSWLDQIWALKKFSGISSKSHREVSILRRHHSEICNTSS